MDQVNIVEDSLYNISLGPFMNILPHMNTFRHEYFTTSI